jgi:hypothetical protein
VISQNFMQTKLTKLINVLLAKICTLFYFILLPNNCC